MAEISKELLAKLMKAASPEEASALLSAEGITDAPTDEVWQQLEELRARQTQDAQELSLDELDDVAGGRDWYEEGCANTVEPGSSCWENDAGLFHNYEHKPNGYCPRCGEGAHFNEYFQIWFCRHCDGKAQRGGASGGW